VTKLKVAIVVDNPFRDLNGCIFLASKLASSGHDVYLVEMYSQLFNVPSILPDVIIVNYVRSNNIEYIRYYKSLGINVIVLDTEGSWTENVIQSATDGSKNGLLAKIDYYFFWGRNQYTAAKHIGILDSNKLFISGCPRYDFCRSKDLASFGEGETIDKEYILINTRFPRSNPKFTSGDNDEIAGMIRAGFSYDQAVLYLEDDHKARTAFLKYILKLSELAPQEHFIIRPHPFESEDPYIDLVKKNSIKNIEVIKEGTSIKWISNAKLLIHQNCTTSVEANMLSIPCVSLEWFNSERLVSPIAKEACLNIYSFEDLLKYVSSDTFDLSYTHNKKLLKDYFNYSPDGPMSSDSVVSFFNERAAELLKKNRSNIFDFCSLKFVIYQKLRLTFGYGFLFFVRKLFKTKGHYKLTNKSYSVSSIESVLNFLKKNKYVANDVVISRVKYRSSSDGIVLFKSF